MTKKFLPFIIEIVYSLYLILADLRRVYNINGYKMFVNVLHRSFLSTKLNIYYV